jgi:hypothetical protein
MVTSTTRGSLLDFILAAWYTCEGTYVGASTYEQMLLDAHARTHTLPAQEPR